MPIDAQLAIFLFVIWSESSAQPPKLNKPLPIIIPHNIRLQPTFSMHSNSNSRPLRMSLLKRGRWTQLWPDWEHFCRHQPPAGKLPLAGVCTRIRNAQQLFSVYAQLNTSPTCTMSSAAKYRCKNSDEAHNDLYTFKWPESHTFLNLIYFGFWKLSSFERLNH